MLAQTLDSQLSRNVHLKRTVTSMEGLRVEARDLLAALRILRDNLRNLSKEQPKASESKQECEQILEEFDLRVRHNSDQMKTILEAGQKVAKEDPHIEMIFAADFKSIENQLEELERARSAFVATQKEDAFTRIESTLQSIKTTAALESLPTLLRAHMEQMRWGYAMNFHRTFKGFLESADDRREVLLYLQNHPKIIGGIVRADEGLIYRVAHRPWVWYASTLCLAFLALVGIPLFYLALDFFGESLYSDWPLNDVPWRHSMGTYLLALCGSALHLLIAFLKRKDMHANPLDALLWIHARWVSFAQGILGIGVVVFAAILASGGSLDWETAILLGYSSDSFIDIVVERFESYARIKSSKIEVQWNGEREGEGEGEGKESKRPDSHTRRPTR